MKQTRFRKGLHGLRARLRAQVQPELSMPVVSRDRLPPCTSPPEQAGWLFPTKKHWRFVSKTSLQDAATGSQRLTLALPPGKAKGRFSGRGYVFMCSGNVLAEMPLIIRSFFLSRMEKARCAC